MHTDTVTVWYVHNKGALDSEWEFDDQGGYFPVGEQPYDVPGYYATKDDAQAACDAMNRDPSRLSYGPFSRHVSYRDGGSWKYSDSVLLPWPMFCDWLKERDIPRPMIDDDEDGKVVEGGLCGPNEIQAVIDGAPPDRDVLEEWWTCMESYEHETGRPIRQELAEVVRWNRLYEVGSKQLGPFEINQMRLDLAVVETVMSGAVEEGVQIG